MSHTRKKLARVFRAPSTDGAGGFAPRALDRAPREFDEDGRLATPAPNPTPTAASRPATPDEAPAPTPADARASAAAHAPTHNAASPAPDAALRQHSMTAAERAFASWGRAQGRASTEAPAATAGPRPDTHAADRSKPDAPRPIATPTPPAQRSSIHHDAQRHSLRIAQRPHEREGGISPRASLDAWRSQREAAPEAPTIAAAPTTAEAAAPRHAAASASAVPEPIEDRTRARAKRAHSFPQSRDAARAAKASVPASTTPVPEPRRPPAPPRPAGHDPAETIMWVVAHEDALSSSARREALEALDVSALRATLQARRLRLLASALTELGERELALTHLRALHALLPHDSWAMLQLATLCADDASTRAEALHWCDVLLRQSPWLAHVQALRARIVAAETRGG